MSDKMSAEKELEEQLKEAGNKLLEPPSSLDELLPLLDQVENFLSRVEQSPAKSMQAALSPLTKALVADELLRHSDVDVKVAVASCISEITRITAPDAPYDDDKMKDVFQLIVSSFENLSDKSSRSYNKRALILETVAKVRSCVVMLDLECDGLIAEMFQLFLGTIRDNHPQGIFSSMETIMTLVLEESEDISPEILTPLLAAMKKDNKEVLPVAVKLAEKVFENCAVKLKPYLSLAIKSLDVSLADYSGVVTSICEEGPSAIRPIDGNVPAEQSDLEDKLASTSINEDKLATQADGSKPTASTVDETVQVAKGKEACPEEMDADTGADRSPKMVMSNGVDETGTKKVGASGREENGANLNDQPSSDMVTSKPEVEDSEAGAKMESKLDHPDRISGKKSSASTNVSESSDTSHVEGEKESEELPDLQDSYGKGVHDSPRHGVDSVSAKPSDRDASIELSSPKASETEAGNVASPTGENLHDDHGPKKVGRSKKKESSQEETPLLDFLSKKGLEGANDSEVKPHKRTGKKALADATDEDKMSTDKDTSKISSGGASDSETKKMKEIDKKIDESSNIDESPSMKKKKDGKKRGRGKAALENEIPKSSSKDDQKEVSSSKSPTRSAKDEESHEETHRTNSKSKRSAGKDKVSETLEYGDNLVGTKVKVWWPRDREYYEGTIDSFDAIKKKHKVLYTDGDEETLNLKKERWEFVEDSLSSEEQTAEQASPDSASGVQKRKKAKTVSESSAKHGKTEVSPKSGAASTSKSKGTASKSGRKSKDDGKIDLKLKDKTPKPGAKLEDDISGKPKVHSSKTGGRHVDDSPKTATKSKDLEGKAKSKQESPKMASKSKQESQKTGSKSKGKTSQGGGDHSSNGLGKVKPGSSKTKEAGVLKEKSFEVAKTQGVKGRSSELRAQESETVSTKKRRRG